MVSYKTANSVSTPVPTKSLVSFKNSNLERFYSEFSNADKKDVYSFFIGGTSTSTENNTIAGKRIWGDVSLIRNIGRDEVHPVTERINYETGKVYDPFLASGNAADDQYYVYNNQNGFVYLCISSNAKNRKDLFRQSNSTKTPVHTEGYRTYSDGYTWLPLYKIDDKIARFVTESYIPVANATIDYQEFSNTVGLENRYDSICGLSGASGGTGSCCTYAKEKEQKWPNNGTYAVGDFVDCICDVPNCFTCQIYGEKLNRDVVFIAGTGGCSGCASSITVLDNTTKIKNSNPNVNTNDNYQVKIKEDGSRNNGQIVSAFIDFSGISLSNREVKVPSAKVVVGSETGHNADINLITYLGSDKKYYADGIEIKNRGKNYSEDYVLSIPDAATNTIETLLTNAIDLSLDDVEDNIEDDPRKLLNVSKLLFNIAIKDSEISSVIDQKSFTRYGIIKNVLNTDETIFAKTKNISEKSTNSNLTSIRIRKKDNTTITTDEFIPVANSVFATSTGAVKGTVTSFERDASFTNRADVSIATPNPNSFTVGSSFTVTTAGGGTETFLITNATLPVIKPNSGSLLFSNSAQIDIPTDASSNRPTRNFRFIFLLDQ